MQGWRNIDTTCTSRLGVQQRGAAPATAPCQHGQATGGLRARRAIPLVMRCNACDGSRLASPAHAAPCCASAAAAARSASPVRLARQETTTSTLSLKATLDRLSMLITSPNRTSAARARRSGGHRRRRPAGSSERSKQAPPDVACSPEDPRPPCCCSTPAGHGQRALCWLLPRTSAGQVLLHVLGRLLAANAGPLARKGHHVVAAADQLPHNKLSDVPGGAHHQHAHVLGCALPVVCGGCCCLSGRGNRTAQLTPLGSCCRSAAAECLMIRGEQRQSTNLGASRHTARAMPRWGGGTRRCCRRHYPQH